MEKNKDRERKRLRRKRHIRKRVFGTPERPRLTVFKSNKHIYGQLVNDEMGKTLAAVSTMGKESKTGGEAASKTGTRTAAAAVGGLLAQRALELGIKRIVFDRNGYRFHGRVKELAEAARKGGLEF